MSRTTFKAAMREDEVNAVDATFRLRDVKNVETIGKDIVIHRTIERNDVPENDSGTITHRAYSANGKGWVVSLKGSGMSLVTDIDTRAEARAIAQRLAPQVEAFKAAVQAERKLQRDKRFTF